MTFRSIAIGLSVILLTVIGLPTRPLSVAAEDGDLVNENATTKSTKSLPEPSPSDLPQWRGFNLLEKFHLEWNNGPFVEDDFRWISEFGFNFVRLPMDYRVWIEGNDWNQFDENELKEIDQAIGWGKKYGIHVCLNFHRAPGYTVASPPEKTDLWTDTQTQKVCERHWALFAKRYRGIPNRNLSFNLFNEPPDEAGDQFEKVVRQVVAAIRAEDPDRLIISDGLTWGLQPVIQLADLDIAQATRGYTPHSITHYGASWVAGSKQFARPTWPRIHASGILYAESKTDLPEATRRPLTVHGDFTNADKIRFRVHTVSSRSKLSVHADGKQIFQKTFEPGPDRQEWKEVHYQPRWDTYQNILDRNLYASIPAGTKQISLQVDEGDWISISEIAIQYAGDDENACSLMSDWGQPPADLAYAPNDSRTKFQSPQAEDRQWLWETTVKPWVRARQEHGIGVLVGEFGCHNQTPHDVTLAWMEDVLANWRQAKFGWALWNFRGSFGILDSGRDDVEYEDFRGHKLDRKMLELLQAY